MCVGKIGYPSVFCENRVRAIDVLDSDGAIDLDVIEYWARKGSILVSDNNLHVMTEAFLQAYDSDSLK